MYSLFRPIGKVVLDSLNEFFQKLDYQRVIVWPLYKFAAFKYVFHNGIFELTVAYARLDTEVKFIVYYTFCTTSPTSSFVNVITTPVIKPRLDKIRTFFKFGSIELIPDEVKLVEDVLLKFFEETIREVQVSKLVFPAPKLINVEECDLIDTFIKLLVTKKEASYQQIDVIPGVKFSAYIPYLHRIVIRKIEKDFVKELTKGKLTIEEILREPFLVINYSLKMKLWSISETKNIQGLHDFLTIVLPKWVLLR